MIRFSAALVVVAIGVLVGGMATSSLLLVYVAIGLSVGALLTLALGVALKREEIFGEQGQSALAGQGANAGFGQERPDSTASAERSAAPGGQDVLGEPFGQHAAAFGQEAWAAAPEVSPWRERFASPVPQPAAQARADVAQTRLDTTLTRADLAKTRADLTEAKADPAGTKADTAPDRSAALHWFDRIASAQPAGDEPVADAGAEDHADDIKAEDADAAGSPADVASVDEADSPAGDANAGTEDATAEAETAEAETAEDEEEAGTADTEAADSSPDGDQEGRSGQREVTVVPGVPRYHDASCILIRFMGDDDLQKMTLDEATEAGCTPCRACMPEHA